MKPYLLSLGAGLLVGALYALLNVRSPAPPVIALLGLLGILIGEQAVSGAKGLMARASAPVAVALQPKEQPASFTPASDTKSR